MKTPMNFLRFQLTANHLPAALLFVLLVATSPAFAQDFNDPGKVLEIMEKSKVSYKVLMDKDFQAPAPKLGQNNTPFTYQEIVEGEATIGTYELDSAAQTLYQEAEKAFVAGDYPLARSKYMALHELRPNIGVIVTYIGQTHEAEGNPTEAIKWLKSAIDINFHDYMAHWFLASNHFKLKQYDLASEEIAIAWVLNRNHSGIREAAVSIFKAAGIKFEDFEFRPRYTVQQNGEEVEIRFSEDWMMYSFCKALWQFEPGYHRELGGGRGEFDIHQEKECLLNLVLAYDRTHKGKKGKDPAINAAVRALTTQQINAFIFMEIWLPQEPVIIYTQTQEAVQQLAAYILEVRTKD
jgi:tetratricopeptide (TPR) repeat protein